MSDVRRNDYIASIRYDISEIDTELSMFDSLERQQKELIDYCKKNKLLRFKWTVQYELKLIRLRNRFNTRFRKKLIKLLSKAERYTPGRQTE